jgi:hypothetical protein
MVVSERDVVPLRNTERLAGNLDRRPLIHRPPRNDTLDLAVQQEHVVPRIGIGGEGDARAGHVRNGEDRQVVLRDVNAARRRIDDMHAKLGEQPEDVAGFSRSRRVVIAGDHHHRAVRQRLGEACELVEGVQDRRIRRANVVKDVPREQHHIGTQLDRAIDGALEGSRDVRLALVDASRGQPLILPKAEMNVREVEKAHGRAGM